jgi:hypothetical protein
MRGAWVVPISRPSKGGRQLHTRCSGDGARSRRATSLHRRPWASLWRPRGRARESPAELQSWRRQYCSVRFRDRGRGGERKAPRGSGGSSRIAGSKTVAVAPGACRPRASSTALKRRKVSMPGMHVRSRIAIRRGPSNAQTSALPVPDFPQLRRPSTQPFSASQAIVRKIPCWIPSRARQPSACMRRTSRWMNGLSPTQPRSPPT